MCRGPATPILDQLGATPPPLSDPSAWPAGWTHVHNKNVTVFNAAGPAWLATDFKLNPTGDMCDGLWDITMDKYALN